ncbi:MAG: hypothetical protein QOE55_1453 [Acidobacteriaceae bacterium]|jgi:hypothetical protein|nr:hypothetical protein [Acidobacteriaceae bacterium]
MAKLLPHAVHSYKTTFPNNIVCGTSLDCSNISSNKAHVGNSCRALLNIRPSLQNVPNRRCAPPA